MFFKKLFGKDCSHYVEKGRKYLAQEHFAEARLAFEEALEKIQNGAGDVALETEIRAGLAEAGNRLGAMNLEEAEHCARRGDGAKAEEHLNLVLELASDPDLHQKAKEMVRSLTSMASASPQHHHGHDHKGCSGCSPAATPASEEDTSAPHLSPQERFELLIHPLPQDLPVRYARLGERFADAYLLLQDGDANGAAKVFQELLVEEESDILLYELAMINFRNRNGYECERLLRRAIEVNDNNPLCHFGLVHLLAETGRLPEAVPVLRHMIDQQMMIEQAMLTLGDVYQGLGNAEAAIETYTQTIPYPAATKPAAERLVPLLQKLGRGEEAAYVAKTYLKGCC